MPWEAAGDDSSTWVRVMHVGDPDGVPGPCLLPGLVLAVVAFWGMGQQIDRSMFISPSLCATVRFKQNFMKNFISKAEQQREKERQREKNPPSTGSLPTRL